MSSEKSLKPYREKRDFHQTPEPFGQGESPGKPVYVIQKHDASHLHYDLRLEIESVLKSWAVPKGPSLDPKVRRLALLVEDHPISYAGFEGTIPEGQYGGGTVMVWDKGTYRNLQAEKPAAPRSMEQSFGDGKIEVYLDGDKLKGAFALVKTKQSEKSWLFFKMKDEFAQPGSDITVSEPDSAITGRTIDEIAAGKE